VKKKESNLGIISELIELKIIRFHVMTTETSEKMQYKNTTTKKNVFKLIRATKLKS